MSDVQSIPFDTIDGGTATLGDYAGQVALVVNVASKCGLTPQYDALEAIYERYHEKGFQVLAFPANNFGAQEPGTNDEILEFCRSTYSVKFPVFAKISVVGDDKHPLYEALTSSIPHASGDPESHRDRLKGFGIAANEDPEVLWNFEKFLIDREGNVVGRYAPNLVPDDPALIADIEAKLA
jgi:glutathione peroxidase